MNILIVSENFSHGGLERQILTQKRSLNKVKFIYAFEKYVENDELKDCKIYNLNHVETIDDFLKSVKKLIFIIKKEKIDYIHVHPFYSVFPAIFAAHIAGVKMCYTIHGCGSVWFPFRTNEKILFSYFLNEMDDRIFTVSKTYKEKISSTFNRNNISYLPNCIDKNQYKECKFVNNGKWLLISRLDSDKKKEIIEVIKNIDKLGIKKLDIIGDGDSRKEIEKNAKFKNVEFFGYNDNITSFFQKGYNGVIGIGQVVLEGLMSNLPVLLIGSGRITGLVDLDMYNKIKNYNFGNRYVTDDSLENISERIKKIKGNKENYRLRNKVIEEYDSCKAYDDYYKIITSDNYSNNKYFEKIYNELNSSKINKNENFYDSYKVYELLRKYFKNFSVNQNVLNLFNFYDFKFNVENIKLNINEQITEIRTYQNELQKEIQLLNSKYDVLEKRFDRIMNNKFVRFYRTIKKKLTRK